SVGLAPLGLRRGPAAGGLAARRNSSGSLPPTGSSHQWWSGWSGSRAWMSSGVDRQARRQTGVVTQPVEAAGGCGGSRGVWPQGRRCSERGRNRLRYIRPSCVRMQGAEVVDQVAVVGEMAVEPVLEGREEKGSAAGGRVRGR